MVVQVLGIRWLALLVLVVGVISLWPIGGDAVWSCAEKSSNSRPPQPSTSNQCTTRYKVPVEQEGALKVALARDPFAEYNYHFLCQNPHPPEEEDVADGEGLQQRTPITDFHKCRAGPYPPRIPGLDKMQLGYNIVTDQLSSTTAHTPILDVISSEKYNATMEGLNFKCYLVPDAFISSIDIGVVIINGSATGSKDSTSTTAIGSSSVGEYRKRLVETRIFELGLGVSGFSTATDSAFSRAESITKLREMVEAEGKGDSDVSSISHFVGLYRAHIHSPLPTNDLVAEWIKLMETPTSVAYQNYFNEFGTHYFVSAVIGARFTAAFTTRPNGMSGSSPQGRAECIALKMRRTFHLNSNLDSNNHVCERNYIKEVAVRAPAADLVGRFHTLCEGGIARNCPRLLASGLTEWTNSIRKNPTVLLGEKRWITQLVETVRDEAAAAAGGEGLRAEQYKKIVETFGGLGQIDKFSKQLKLELAKYLSDHKYM